jgi:hypothetical protein
VAEWVTRSLAISPLREVMSVQMKSQADVKGVVAKNSKGKSAENMYVNVVRTSGRYMSILFLVRAQSVFIEIKG